MQVCLKARRDQRAKELKILKANIRVVLWAKKQFRSFSVDQRIRDYVKGASALHAMVMKDNFKAAAAGQLHRYVKKFSLQRVLLSKIHVVRTAVRMIQKKWRERRSMIKDLKDKLRSQLM